jgi:hypothetical protein
MDLQSSMTRNLSPKAYPPPHKEAVKTSMPNFSLFLFGFPLVPGCFYVVGNLKTFSATLFWRHPEGPRFLQRDESLP